MPRTEVRGGQILDTSVSLTADVFGVLPSANGGTGNSTNVLNNVLLGNGTGALQNVAPGASGNVLTSNGTTFTSSAPVGGGSPTTTKGDLAGFSTVSARVPVGADGFQLIADSGKALGIDYQNVAFLNRRKTQVTSNPGLLTLTAMGFATAPTITAAALTTQGDDADGSAIILNTTAAAGGTSNVASLYTQFKQEWESDVSFKIKTTASGLTAFRMWVGLFSATPAALDAPLVHIAGFRYISTGPASNANWVGITAAGTATQTVVDSGVVVAVNTTYVLRVQCVGSVVNFYVNNKYVGQSSTNLPTAATLLGIGAHVTALAATAVSAKFGWCSTMQK